MIRALYLTFFILTITASQLVAQCNIIYVIPTPFAIPTADLGTKADPTSLDNAINNLAQAGDVIKLSVGTYTLDNAIGSLPDFVTIEGGYDATNNWIKTSQADITTIYRNSNNVRDFTSPTARISAFELNGARGFRLQDLSIEVQDAPAAGTYGISLYGVYCNNCSDYKIVRCKITTGDASAGANGSTGTVGAVGQPGIAGTDGEPNNDVAIVNGGIGGLGGGSGSAAGTAGLGNASVGGDSYNVRLWRFPLKD